MFVYRVEHDREVCDDYTFGQGGTSYTGHGPSSGWNCTINVPNFGVAGNPPNRTLSHYHRCAVTARQFPYWITPSPFPGATKLMMLPGWSIIQYWLDDESEGDDWWIDQGQIIFDSEADTCLRMGTVTQRDVLEYADAERNRERGTVSA